MESGEIIIPKGVTLEIISGVDKGKIFTVTGKTMTIGRAAECDFQLSDKHVSNNHCQIVFRRDHFTAIDLESLNKTKVNGKVYIQKNLRTNDLLTLGKTEIRFVWKDQDEKVLDPSEDIPAEAENADAESFES